MRRTFSPVSPIERKRNPSPACHPLVTGFPASHVTKILAAVWVRPLWALCQPWRSGKDRHAILQHPLHKQSTTAKNAKIAPKGKGPLLRRMPSLFAFSRPISIPPRCSGIHALPDCRPAPSFHPLPLPDPDNALPCRMLGPMPETPKPLWLVFSFKPLAPPRWMQLKRKMILFSN